MCMPSSLIPSLLSLQLRPRRVFSVGGLRLEAYSYLLSRAREYLPKHVQNNPNSQLLAVIPISTRQGYNDLTKFGSERIDRLAHRMRRVSTLSPYRRRLPPRRYLAVGAKKIAYLDGGRVAWSCLRSQIFQIELIESYQSGGGDGGSCAYFLRFKHFTDFVGLGGRAALGGAGARSWEETSLAKRVKDGYYQQQRGQGRRRPVGASVVFVCFFLRRT